MRVFVGGAKYGTESRQSDGDLGGDQLRRKSPRKPREARRRFLRTYPYAKYGTTCLAAAVSLVKLYQMFRGGGGAGHL
jgi:hypothetical protein